MMKYCRGCGEQKRLTWPTQGMKPEYCSMRCAAASHFYAHDFLCNDCGQPVFEAQTTDEGCECP